MTPQISNVHRDHARLLKVIKFADYVASQGFTAELMSVAGDSYWRILAERAGVNPLHEESKAMAIQRLKATEEASHVSIG